MEDDIKKLPDLDIADLIFTVKLEGKTGSESYKKLIGQIEEKKMLPLYKHLVESLKWTEDSALAERLKAENQDELKKLDEKIKDSVENFGESEIREAYLAKSDYYCRIGDKSSAVEFFRQTFEKTVPLGQKLDIVFTLIRMGIFWMDHDLVTRNLEKAKSLVEEGGDWDKKNRLKTYEAVYLMSIRKFEEASNLFLETVASFTSVEFIEYSRFVEYLVFTSLLHLDRVSLKQKVIDSPDVLSVINDVPRLQDLLLSFYNGDYANFFSALAHFSDDIKGDRYLAEHSRFFTREMRILAYTQYLESYSSVKLESISNQFGVSVDFIDKELSRFVAAGRLNCKVDKVSGVIETTRSDVKNQLYKTTLQQSDNLLNRIQKLSRVINV
ncbi:26S proteasome non-ATPase regulatory subunit 6 [Dictyostelium purpureum]|uniref:26S proteasome non-ATPase regulatory subunit 6 n=1 Tax=Dictyostelium purpureum TaxID=5786 RepID=F0ZAS3_DICPU|nr:26S proteasome non-ATPase regulatory subunit 6 [Dictyostelium purpureum]EGC38972.1 26S proteasome non-ATPase regulatory subunit 6 [Dictyostelium purpureum]|eukprot:XP_003284537.1 26S proteasome non-ATPase regulatory subunit 6 [Dictyostelium purpureum]